MSTVEEITSRGAPEQQPVVPARARLLLIDAVLVGLVGLTLAIVLVH